MKEKLMNNWSLKLIALIVSVVIWMFVVNYDNPMTTRTISGIPIEIANEETITENNMIYSVPGTPTASVRIHCNRRLAESLRVTDFKAVADFNNLYSLTNQIPVTITCTNSRLLSDEMTPLTHSLAVELEKIETRTMELQVVLNGTPAAGYRVGDTGTSPNSIRVQAPSSFLDQVSFAGVQVDVEGISQSVNKSLPVQFFSAGGNPLDTSALSFLSVNRENVDVEVEILNVKSVNINYTVTGQDQVAPGYMYAGIDLSRSTVQISGRKTTLAEISAIVIPEGALDITDADANVDKTFDLRELLPDGVELVDPEEAQLDVSIKIERQSSREYTLNISRVEIQNMGEGLRIVNGDTFFNLTVQGLESDLDALGIQEIQILADLKDCTAGVHAIPLEVSVPHGFWVVEPPTVTIHLEPEVPEVPGDGEMNIPVDGEDFESGETTGPTVAPMD